MRTPSAAAARLRDPLRRSHVVWHVRELDAAVMDRAARPLAGLHDFAAFCKPREGDKDPYKVNYDDPQRMVAEDGVHYTPPLRAGPY